jgi:hypothetical protein
MRVVNDAYSAATNWLVVERTANTVDSINLSATEVTIGAATTYGAVLTVDGASDQGHNGTIHCYDNAAVAVDVGGGIVFGGIYTGTSRTEWAAIYGLKETATSGQYGGYLSFMVRDHGGSLTERFKVSAEGNVWAGGENVNEAGLGYDMDTAGHEGISMWHDGTRGYVASIDSGTAWHEIYYRASKHVFQYADTTRFEVGNTDTDCHNVLDCNAGSASRFVFPVGANKYAT